MTLYHQQQTEIVDKYAFFNTEKEARQKQNRKWKEKWKEKKYQQSSTGTSLIFIHEIWHNLTLNIGI